MSRGRSVPLTLAAGFIAALATVSTVAALKWRLAHHGERRGLSVCCDALDLTCPFREWLLQ